MAEEAAARLWILLAMLAMAASFRTIAGNGDYPPAIMHRHARSTNFAWSVPHYYPDSIRTKLCIGYIIGVNGLFPQESTTLKCGHDANFQTISCQPFCYGNARKMEIFAVHDQLCTAVHRVVLTLNRIDHSGQLDLVLGNTGSETMATFNTTETCSGSEYYMAKLEPRMEQGWNCDDTEYVYSVTLFGYYNEPVTCPDGHISFHTRAPLTN